MRVAFKRGTTVFYYSYKHLKDNLQVFMSLPKKGQASFLSSVIERFNATILYMFIKYLLN